MKIIIQGRNIILTSAIKTYIETKLGTLGKFVKRWDGGGAAILRVEVSRATRHHKKGDVFYAEANLDIPGTLLRAEAYDADARLAVNVIRKTLELEIKKRKEREERGRRPASR